MERVTIEEARELLAEAPTWKTFEQTLHSKIREDASQGISTWDVECRPSCLIISAPDVDAETTRVDGIFNNKTLMDLTRKSLPGFSVVELDEDGDGYSFNGFSIAIV